MKSFPSTLNRGGVNLSVPSASSSIKNVLSTAWKSAVNQGIGAMTSGYRLDTEGIRYSEDQNKENLLDNMNITNFNDVMMTHTIMGSGTVYEDPFHIPLNAIDVVNKYRAKIYSGPIENWHTPIKKGATDEPEFLQTSLDHGVTGSLFNPYYAMLSEGPTSSTPLLIGQTPKFTGTDDCSISNLIKLSKISNDFMSSPLGQARYKYSDFMYCKDLGKIANNHLITLRRFSTPVGDNIFTEAANPDKENNFNMAGDIGRLITWFGTEENKLEDILKYDFHASWLEKEPAGKDGIQQVKKDDTDLDGDGFKNILNKTAMLLSPSFLDSVKKGANPSFTLPFKQKPISAGKYLGNEVVMGEMYDANKVYAPKNVIRSTHIYEGKLLFNHEFDLVFSYKLRAYDNINPKAAFLDLLANILTVTYRRGEFWGGRQEVLGAHPNNSAYGMVYGLIDKSGQWTKNFVDQLINAGSGKEIAASILGGISNAFDGVKEAIGNLMEGKYLKPNFSSIFNGTIDLMGGLAKGYLGRPDIYALSSLLTGDNVGLWHVTIGNPLNPIAAFGNLILEKAEVTHSGPLGIDDFPSELKVKVTLKHAMPRDSVRIQKMYTKGMTGIYQNISGVTNPTDIYNLSGMGFMLKGKTAKDLYPDKKFDNEEDANKIIPTKNEDGLYTIERRPDYDTVTKEIYEGSDYLSDFDMGRIQTNRYQLV